MRSFAAQFAAQCCLRRQASIIAITALDLRFRASRAAGSLLTPAVVGEASTARPRPPKAPKQHARHRKGAAAAAAGPAGAAGAAAADTARGRHTSRGRSGQCGHSRRRRWRCQQRCFHAGSDAGGHCGPAARQRGRHRRRCVLRGVPAGACNACMLHTACCACSVGACTFTERAGTAANPPNPLCARLALQTLSPPPPSSGALGVLPARCAPAAEAALQRLLGARASLVAQQRQLEQRCVTDVLRRPLGFHQGRPVAALLLYRCVAGRRHGVSASAHEEMKNTHQHLHLKHACAPAAATAACLHLPHSCLHHWGLLHAAAAAPGAARDGASVLQQLGEVMQQQLDLEDESAPAEVAGLQCHVAYWCAQHDCACASCCHPWFDCVRTSLHCAAVCLPQAVGVSSAAVPAAEDARPPAGCRPPGAAQHGS